MSKKTSKNFIVGLDIGTTKVVALVGEVLPTDRLRSLVSVAALAWFEARRGGQY